MSRTVLSSSNAHRAILRRDLPSERVWTSRRTSRRSSSMGALRRCGIKPLLGFFVFFISCQLFLAFLHAKQAGNTIGNFMELQIRDNKRAFPITLSRDLKKVPEMQRDLNQVRDANSKASLHSENGKDDDYGNADVVVLRDDKSNHSAAILNQDGPERTKMQNTKQEEVQSRNMSKVKYILPVLLGNQGPNNQIQAMKLVSIIAQRRNLTVVLAPFFDHGATIETQRPHTFNETFDADVLSKFVSVATMEEFKRQCKSKADVVFLGTNMVPNQSLSQTDQIKSFIGQTIKVYYNLTQIQIPSTFLTTNRSDHVIQIADDLPYYKLTVDDFLDTYPDSLTTSHQCNAFLYPYGYLGRLKYSEHISRYIKYFVRGKVVRETAQNFITTAMKNMTYVCIHWRFNKEWKSAWCRHDFAQDLCNSLDALTPSQLASNISHFMAESDIKAAYFASELDNQTDLIKGLREGVPNIHTTSDLIEQSPKLSHDNNYLTSLTEQELCKESTFFLASHLSSWSQMVKEDRYDKNWKEVNELFKSA